jgi:ABC-type bacteriocin/lantibiotic exporter with double-glycine peptidase domain
MPNVLLPVPHFEQSRDGACLPACVQMVLSHLGDERTEADFAELLGTKDYGTPIRNVERLREEGYGLQVGQITRTELVSYLEEGRPVIVRVWTPMLDYWLVDTSHVVVVVGYDEATVFLNDPAIPTAPQRVAWIAFLAAWAEYDETAVVISRR